MKKIFYLISIFAMTSSASYADIITLKNGAVVEGKISDQYKQMAQ